MNTLKAILIVVIGITVGLIIAYMLKIPFAVALIDAIKAKIASVNIGGINIGSIASIASITGLAGTAYQLVKANKDKAAAIKSATTESENSKQLAQKLLEVDGIKADAEKKLAETQATLEAKTEEYKGMTDEVTLLRNQAEKNQITIDTLHETLRRNKLTDGEAIIKTVVK